MIEVMESEQKYKITLKPFSGGRFIHVYESYPEFGYVVLESDEPFFCPTLLRDINLKSSDVKSFKFPKRQALLKGKIEILKKFVKASNDKTLPGRIRITEYLEDEIPEDVKKVNISDDIPFEEAIKPYLLVFKPKNDSIENRIRDRFREKSNDEVLTKNGKRIVRFFTYQGDNKADLLIKDFDIEFVSKTPIITGIDVPVNEPEEEEIEISKDEETNKNSLTYNVKIVVFNNLSSDSNPIIDNSDGSFIEVEEILRQNDANRKRVALIFGIGSELKLFIEEKQKDGYLPGKIIRHEYRESQIPQKYLRITSSSVVSADYIKGHIEFSKKKDSFGNLIKLNDDQIVIFYEYLDQQNSEDIFVDLQNKERKVVNIVSAPNSTQRERSLASVKRENAVMLPLVALLVLGSILVLIMLPSLFTAVSVIVGSLIIFYFAGAFYEAIFTKPIEFDLLRTILVGIVVIIILGIFLFISELTKTPYDLEMWRHP